METAYNQAKTSTANAYALYQSLKNVDFAGPAAKGAWEGAKATESTARNNPSIFIHPAASNGVSGIAPRSI